MRHAELEARVLRIADQVERRQPVEGSNVELKAEWPKDIPRAARQLAGHCNAARGEPVTWIIGLDEERGVVGASKEELANWWPAICAEFDRETPSLKIDMPVGRGSQTLFVMYFETERMPFVTRVRPVAGKAPGEVRQTVSAELEVPWREGSRTRSARREDLLRLLLPVTNSPELDLRSVNLYYRPSERHTNWSVEADFKFYAIVRSPITLPAHHCFLAIKPEHLDRGQWSRHVELRHAERPGAQEDIHFHRSTAFHVRFGGITNAIGPMIASSLSCRVELQFIDAVSPFVSEIEVRQSLIGPNGKFVEYRFDA